MLGGQQVLDALLDLVPAETGPQQDGDEHRCGGEEDRVAGDEVAESGERRSQPPVQDLPQHSRAEAAQEAGEARTTQSLLLKLLSQSRDKTIGEPERASRWAETPAGGPGRQLRGALRAKALCPPPGCRGEFAGASLSDFQQQQRKDSPGGGGRGRKETQIVLVVATPISCFVSFFNGRGCFCQDKWVGFLFFCPKVRWSGGNRGGGLG